MEVPPGDPTVRTGRTDDGPRLARLLGAGADAAAVDRATALVPDADEVSRVLLVAELAGEVVGYATLVWVHVLQLPGPVAHVAELVVAPGTDARVEAALRRAIREQADLVGAVTTGGPGWRGTGAAPTVRELLPGRTVLALPALRELRPHLPADDGAVVARIDEVQRAEGYRLFAVASDDGAAAAVAGFRPMSTLAWGDILYVDDLVTRRDHRGLGYGAALLFAVDEEARRLGRAAVHLDSGHGIDRADAHRLYLRHGYRISSHHLSHELG